jgi:hypothetical protein
MIDDSWRQSVARVVQLLFVAIPARLVLCGVRRGLFLAGGRLGDGSEGTAAGDIHHGQSRNLQSPFGPTGAAIEKVSQPEGGLATLGKKRGILGRAQLRARIERPSQDPLMKVGPLKGRPELARHRARGILTIATQIAPRTTAPHGQDRSKQHRQKLPLWLTHCRHLLQNVRDNCHRPCPA